MFNKENWEEKHTERDSKFGNMVRNRQNLNQAKPAPNHFFENPKGVSFKEKKSMESNAVKLTSKEVIEGAILALLLQNPRSAKPPKRDIRSSSL